MKYFGRDSSGLGNKSSSSTTQDAHKTKTIKICSSRLETTTLVLRLPFNVHFSTEMAFLKQCPVILTLLQSQLQC